MSSKGVILVTGANGYIAAQTVEAFLKAGYAVRGTVRSHTSAKPLFKALAEYGDAFTVVEVPDITVHGAFDEAVKGVDAVAHLASPVSFDFTDPEPVMNAAINGTLQILESAIREPRIKSFVMMSSIVAVLSNTAEDHHYTEADFNTFAEPLVAQQGKNSPGPLIYAASKAAAERVFWEFRDQHHPDFVMTSINPTFVAGPPLVVPESVEKIHPSTSLAAHVYIGRPLDQSGMPGIFHGFVDVRDVARLFVFAVEHPEKVKNERFITSSAYSPPQAVADILRKAYPERVAIIAEGTPGEGYYPGYAYPQSKWYDGSKAVRVTGQDYIPWEQTVVDTVEKLKPILA